MEALADEVAEATEATVVIAEDEDAEAIAELVVGDVAARARKGTGFPSPSWADW